jgi:drug/metabolite transporter (DMT)-like permease
MQDFDDSTARHSGGLYALHLSVLLFGAAGLFGRALTLSPFLIVAGRTFFASVSLLTVLVFSGELRAGRIRSMPAPGAMTRLIAPGVLLAFHWFSFFHSIQLTSVAVGLLTFSSFPAFVILLELIIFGKKLTPLGIFGTAGVLLGLILIVPVSASDFSASYGAAWGILSGFSFALLSIANRELVRDYSPLQLGLLQNSIAFLIIIPFTDLSAGSPGSTELALLAVLGIFCTALAHTLFISSLSVIAASTAAQISTLEPVYGILFAWLLFGEAPDIRTLTGGALILATTTVVSIGSKPRVYQDHNLDHS